MKKLSLRHKIVCSLPLTFLLWLIKDGSLPNFINNAIKIGFEEGSEEYLLRIFKKFHDFPHVILDRSFDWAKTPEGDSYWYRRYITLRNIFRQKV